MEIITMLAVGVALFGVQMTIFVFTMQRMDKLSDRMASLEVGLTGRRQIWKLRRKRAYRLLG